MSVNTRTHNEAIDAPHTNMPSDTQLLGVDEDGCKHYVSPTIERTVWVCDGDAVEHVEDLQAYRGDDPLAAWAQYVRQERGWDRLHFTTGGFGDVLADAVEVDK